MRNLISFYAILSLITFILLGGQGCDFSIEPRFFDLSSMVNPVDMSSTNEQSDIAIPAGCFDVRGNGEETT